MISISSMSKTSSPAQSTFSSGYEREIQGLLKQKMRLNEQLQDVKANDELEATIKADRVKTLTSSIQQLDNQIAQIKMEEFQEKNKKTEQAQQQTQSSQVKEDGQDPSMHQLMKKSQTYDQLGKLVGMRKNVETSVRTMEGENRFDRMVLEPTPGADSGKSIMLENAENTVLAKKREMIQKASSQISKIDEKIEELSQKANEPAPAQTESANKPSSEKEANQLEGSNTASKTTSETDASSSEGIQPSTSASHLTHAGSPISTSSTLDVRV